MSARLVKYLYRLDRLERSYSKADELSELWPLSMDELLGSSFIHRLVVNIDVDPRADRFKGNELKGICYLSKRTTAGKSIWERMLEFYSNKNSLLKAADNYYTYI